MKKLASLLIITAFLFFVDLSYAQDIGLPKGKQAGGLDISKDTAVNNLGTLINNSLTLFFTVGGIGFMIMIIWGAVSWILSGGDKEKIAGARKRITTSIIGLVLLSSVFVIMLVLGQILGIGSLYSGQFTIKGLLEP